MKVVPVNSITYLPLGIIVTRQMYVVVSITDGEKIQFQALFDYKPAADYYAKDRNKLFGDDSFKFEVYEVIPEKDM